MKTGTKREEYNQGQDFFKFFNDEAVNPYERPLVMSYNPFRALSEKVLALPESLKCFELFTGNWAHCAGHSGASGLAKWLEWHYPLGGRL